MSMAESHRFSDAVVVMGVASCGKSTIAAVLAAHYNVAFVEGDKLHPAANVAKMSKGIPLSDEDRWPWLAKVGVALSGESGCMASCSALKRAYRQAICKHAGKPVLFIHLHGSVDLLRSRIAARTGHFMPASLLDSQLATLEMPNESEPAITIDIEKTPQAILQAAINFLNARQISNE